MIELHRASAIERMRLAGRAAADTLAAVGALVRPGLRASEIDRFVRQDTARRGGRPSQLGYGGFPAAVCVSPNDVVCHGVPHARVVLREGDIVNVDVTTELDGYHGDCSAMFRVGAVSGDAARVIAAAEACLMAGIAVVRPNARLGDIGAAIVEVARAHGVSIVDHFGGHGIGRRMHMDPHIDHVGVRGAGPRMRAGMTFTIEPMVNLGSKHTRDDPDGFTVRTADGALSAQAEHTVLVTETGVEILTLPPHLARPQPAPSITRSRSPATRSR